MKKIINFIKQNYPLITILLLAFAVRVWGIYFDFPGTRFIHDETYEISYIAKALAGGTLYPDVNLQYSFFSAILYFPFVLLKVAFIALREGLFGLGGLKAYMIGQGMGELMVITRWVSVLAGTASVYLVYLISRLVWRFRFAALAAAAAYAFSLVPVFLAHWGRRHSLMVFFLLLALYFALKYLKDNKLKYFYWCNLAAALSISAHYLGINALIFPLWVWLANRKEIPLKNVIHNILVYLAAFTVFYLANWPGLKWMVLANLGYYGHSGSASLAPVGALERFYFIFRDVFWVAPAAALLGAALLPRLQDLGRGKYTRLILIGLAFNYIVTVALVAAPRNARWLLAFISLLVVLSFGYWANRLAGRGTRKGAAGLLLALFILPGAVFGFKYSTLLNHNTRIAAAGWIRQNIGQEEIVYSFDYTLELPLSIAAARWQTEMNGVDSAKNRYIIDNEERFNNQGYNLFYDFGQGRYRELAGKETDFVLFSYTDPDSGQAVKENLKQHHELEPVTTFYPMDGNPKIKVGDIVNNPHNFQTLLRLNKSGPYIEIYKLKK